MKGVEGEYQLPDIKVYTTSGRGLNVEELAELAANKIISVADTTAPALKEQARMFRGQLKIVLMRYMHQAIKSDRTTLYNNLRNAGHPEVADIILKI